MHVHHTCSNGRVGSRDIFLIRINFYSVDEASLILSSSYCKSINGE